MGIDRFWREAYKHSRSFSLRESEPLQRGSESPGMIQSRSVPGVADDESFAINTEFYFQKNSPRLRVGF